ncbi:DUF305 domain-containing protein [Chitinophaga sedimenti]|uniref:DUF305 domain-containing protein n=1 Tax=Chitinophaga sedimenti TaxID=2033606 RepID=UPI002003AB9F|nr:DUF305 domain-containing protein [Chitinophaga sedimenti]MCK7554956.1 DUF305 domain-containing protein [Chitinophaga sedimenti]
MLHYSELPTTIRQLHGRTEKTHNDYRMNIQSPSPLSANDVIAAHGLIIAPFLNKVCNMNYTKLFITLAISLVLMYGVMFLNVDRIDHIYLSLTRLYMSILMVAPMALLMIIMMKGMYTSRKRNIAIVSGAVLVFGITLYMLRAQIFISDQQYMKAMIPHHSSAILTSKHADIRDSRVKALSDSIIRSQEEEIALMKKILHTYRTQDSIPVRE